jgi:hypothetical protein
VRDLAGNHHLAVILIAFQGVVTIASTGAASLYQAGCVAVQEAAARDDITPAPIWSVRGVLRSTGAAGKYDCNDSKPRRPYVEFDHNF